MDVLHSSHKFHFVTLHQLEESLDKLLQSSDVYRHSENDYCLVTVNIAEQINGKT